MSFYSKIIRPNLFRIDPEKTHNLTIGGLACFQNTCFQKFWSREQIKDSIKLAGLNFPNRVGLAAGLDKNARAIDGFASMGFGFIEVGTIVPIPQDGNKGKRMFRLPKVSGLINRMGFNSQGLDSFISNLRKSKIISQKRGSRQVLIGINIGKNSTTPIETAINDYIACLDRIYDYADYIAINISSPNTANLRDLQNDINFGKFLSLLITRRKFLADKTGFFVPIFVKIAPDLSETQIKTMALAIQHFGVDGIIATNTTISRENIQDEKAKEQGGLSGSPLLEKSNNVIKTLRSELGKDYPIIGVGGIMSPEDAISKIEAGADVIQFFTGLIYEGPDLVPQIALSLKNSN